MILLVKLFHLLYATAEMQKTQVTFSLTLKLKGEDTWNSKTFKKHERVLGTTKFLRNTESLEK